MKPPAFSIDRQRGAPSLWAPLATTIIGLFLGLCGTVAFVAGFVWLQYRPVWLAGVLLFALSLVAISSGMLSYKTQVDRFKHETQHQHYATPYGRLHAEDEVGPSGVSSQRAVIKSGRPGPSRAPPSAIVLEDTAGWNGSPPQPHHLHACGAAVYI